MSKIKKNNVANTENRVQSKAMLLKQTPDFKVTVFEASKVKEKISKKELKEELSKKRIFDESNRVEDSDDDIFGNGKPRKSLTKKKENEISLKRAKNDVLNFGISGFGTKTKKQMLIEKAIKLGAKKPKNSNKNYKEILEEKKRAAIESEKQSKFQNLGKNKNGLASVRYKAKNKKDTGSLETHYGVVNPKIGKNKRTRK